MILFFRTASNFYSGWSANVTFEPVPSCPLTTTSASTSTSTSTTTTSPTTTTTNAPTGDQCNTVQLSPLSMQWTSPNFGLGNYPNNEPCSLVLSSTSPAWLELQLNTFALHRTDQVSFLRPSTTTLVLKNSQTGVMKLPSMNTVASFLNSATRNGVGFNITISSKTTSCHQYFNANGRYILVKDCLVLKRPHVLDCVRTSQL
ncbi:uncharacterized protein LOC135214538 [Macrobrachium nipponense]|uniref:uncharacterized protein LOC135214538 n=1 Tax=Macrobrachium nipponense TaxID=159736 RepID=UPI0030C8A460